MEEINAIHVLETLRNEAYKLTTRPILKEEFSSWHTECVRTIENIFGKDSDELKEFLRIKFKIDSEILEKTKERITSIVERRFHVSLPGDFELPQDHYYHERLCEAAEVLLAMVLILRRNDRATKDPD